MVKNPIETCRIFRGTSCRCTKERHCLWIGIRPRGLGLRLMSLQLQPGLALDGDKWPLVAFPFPFWRIGIGAGLANGTSEAFADVRPDIRFLMGLRLFDLALRSSVLESVSSSISSSIGAWEATCFFFADRVTGPKYPSCDVSFVSDGVGEGEITLGVAGIMFEEERDMAKGGRDGSRITPEKTRTIFVARSK